MWTDYHCCIFCDRKKLRLHVQIDQPVNVLYRIFFFHGPRLAALICKEFQIVYSPRTKFCLSIQKYHSRFSSACIRALRFHLRINTSVTSTLQPGVSPPSLTCFHDSHALSIFQSDHSRGPLPSCGLPCISSPVLVLARVLSTCSPCLALSC